MFYLFTSDNAQSPLQHPPPISLLTTVVLENKEPDGFEGADLNGQFNLELFLNFEYFKEQI